MENNFSKTAFVVLLDEGLYNIRRFSPISEIDFCGHATLASAFVLFKQTPERKHLVFLSLAAGTLTVNIKSNGVIQMDFPNTKSEKMFSIPF
jgi:PhzF family phenazine biosynthesis protein